MESGGRRLLDRDSALVLDLALAFEAAGCQGRRELPVHDAEAVPEQPGVDAVPEQPGVDAVPEQLGVVRGRGCSQAMGMCMPLWLARSSATPRMRSTPRYLLLLREVLDDDSCVLSVGGVLRPRLRLHRVRPRLRWHLHR